MPTFAYAARDAAGSATEGTIEAASSDEAAKSLRASGKYPTAIRLATANVAAKPTAAARGGVKVRRDEVIAFSNQLSVMLDTGVTLAEALECCAMNPSRPQVKALLDDLVLQVNNGTDLSVALARHPRTFPKLYVALIRASERSGQMGKMLSRATAYLRDEQEILRKVKGALTYPGIMLGFAVLTTVFLLAFVLPRFTTIYANKGAALPVPTQVLMTASHLLIHQWMFLLPATIALVGGGWYAATRTSPGKAVVDWLALNVPGVGGMFRKLYLSRGLRTIGTMASSGVPLVECVETARGLCANGQFNRLWDDVHKQISNGRQMSEPLSASPLVPGAVGRMLASGERGGKLAQVMEQVATFAEHELKEKIHELTRYIEPAMIMLMGLLIGGVTLALLLPVFTIGKVVTK